MTLLAMIAVTCLFSCNGDDTHGPGPAAQGWQLVEPVERHGDAEGRLYINYDVTTTYPETAPKRLYVFEGTPYEMGVVMDLSDRVTVLNFGTKIAEGSPQEIAEDPQVIKAYLGETQQLSA